MFHWFLINLYPSFDSNIDKNSFEKLVSIYEPRYLWVPESDLYFSKFGKIIYSLENYNLIKIDEYPNQSLNSKLRLLLTTSGSTGSQKLVRLSDQNLFSNAQSIINYLSLDVNEKPITTLPMHYSFGLSIINSHLISGATILLTKRSLFEKNFWEFFHSSNPTSISGTPYIFDILNKLRFFKKDFSSVKTITQAGGKLNIEMNELILDYCDKNNKKFYVMYGQTEASPRISYLPPQNSRKKIGSIGIPIPDGKLSLIDSNKKEIKTPGEQGELVYYGKNVCLGYAHSKKDLDKGDENFGTLYTGDIAKKDIDNFFYIVGRKNRFVKLFGHRFNVDDFEVILRSLISNFACKGVDDLMKIFILDTETKSESDILTFISTKTGVNSRGFKVVKVPEFKG